jgi:hypothetical protein
MIRIDEDHPGGGTETQGCYVSNVLPRLRQPCAIDPEINNVIQGTKRGVSTSTGTLPYAAVAWNAPDDVLQNPFRCRYSVSFLRFAL